MTGLSFDAGDALLPSETQTRAFEATLMFSHRQIATVNIVASVIGMALVLIGVRSTTVYRPLKGPEGSAIRMSAIGQGAEEGV